MRVPVFFLAISKFSLTRTHAFIQCKLPTGKLSSHRKLSSSETNNVLIKEEVKQKLTEYLQKRESFSDKKSKSKTIGGTRGNVVLDWVSGAPNKPTVINEADKNIFDYDELQQYGYGDLVPKLMDLGGRNVAYELMNLPIPPMPNRLKPKEARKVVIDRTGQDDKGRYQGLKMTQVLNDDELSTKLTELQKRKANGEVITRSKIKEESYTLPFADSTNKGPTWAPNWTPEELDEEGKRRGKALSWAAKASEGEFKKDPYESLAIENELRMYAIFAAVFTAFAFGKSTPQVISTDIIELIQYPALAIIFAAFGSLFLNVGLAGERNRNKFFWGFKGFIGGPVAIMQLRSLNSLEQEQIS